MNTSLNQYNTIFFAGIGGIGMSALAQLLVRAGHAVTGSDYSSSDLIERLQESGIAISLQQDGRAIDLSLDLLIYSDALPPSHPERLRATELGIPMMSYFEALGVYACGFGRVIAISGTHGKTTTTALCAEILIAAGLNPTAIVGSIVPQWGSNARSGGRDYIVVEACEHQAHMLQLKPDVIVLTNVEFDHPDYYHDLDHVVETFQQYVDSLPAESGLLIFNQADAASRRLRAAAGTLTYSTQIDGTADVQLTTPIEVQHRAQIFSVNQSPLPFELQIPGEFNVANALAAITLAHALDIPDDISRAVLSQFTGVWRRFQVVGTTGAGGLVISDYAHHPTAVAATLQAAREFYPERRLVVVFQPHQRARTLGLFDEFVQCFQAHIQPQDWVAITEIYDVAGRNEAAVDVSSAQLVEAIDLPNVGYYQDAAAVVTALSDELTEQDIFLVMGAGDIYHLAEHLTEQMTLAPERDILEA